MTRLVYRPLPSWTDPVTRDRRSHNFKASWADTTDLLRREVEYLSDDWDVEVVLQVQGSERDVRCDGMLRADAKVYEPGVVVSFLSRHGPLRYACDTFTSGYWRQMPGWQANVRAVALGLEALRKVERYGIAGRGEQYAGWAQLGTGAPTYDVTVVTKDEAVTLLSPWLRPGHAGPAWWRDTVAVDAAYRRGAKVHHPDAGGDPDVFKRLVMARNLLVSLAS